MSKKIHVLCEFVPPKEILTQLEKHGKILGKLKFSVITLCIITMISEVSQWKLEKELYRLSVKVKKLEYNKEE